MTGRSRGIRDRCALWILRQLKADPAEVGTTAGGRWPSTRQAFLWDLAPHDLAPSKDGVVLPDAEPEPQWVTALDDSGVERAIEFQRADTYRRQASIAATEQKASRLLTPFIALLAGGIALTAFELSAVDLSQPLTASAALTAAAFGALGCSLLVIGMSRALDADTRMGLSTTPPVETQMTNRRLTLRYEIRASQVARFVQKNKAERILYARSAISRALAALVVSAVLASIVLVLNVQEPEHPQQQRNDPTGQHDTPTEPSQPESDTPTVPPRRGKSAPKQSPTTPLASATAARR